MIYPQKTPHELYLEEEVKRLRAELDTYKRRDPIDYSAFDEPPVMIVRDHRRPLHIVADGSVENKPHHLHLFATTEDGMGISYQVSKGLLLSMRDSERAQMLGVVTTNLMRQIAVTYAPKFIGEE